MRQVLEQFVPKNFEEIKQIKKSLRQCKNEWLEQKKGKRGAIETYMGHNTMRQILDNAVDGITYWDFGIIEQWKEEVYAYNKNTGQWNFDGYVFHVRGFLFIPGIGQREQFGCKVAVGGKDNQDSAYKAAASNCFTKVASMFGVGEEIYSKIKVEAEQEEMQYQQMQQDPNYSVGQQPQQWSQQQQWGQGQQQYQQPQQNQYQQQYEQQYQQPQYQQQEMPQQWQQHAQQQQQFQQQEPSIQQTAAETDQAMNQGSVQAPFENVGAQQNSFEAQPQGTAQKQEFQATTQQFGAPVAETNKVPETNPWQEAGTVQQLQRYAAHKDRLKITDDNLMVPWLRDFFKNEQADTNYLTPENLQGFNDYLENISA